MAVCEHCGTGFQAKPEGERYCCAGCEYVAGLIHEGGWERFYDLKRGQAMMPVKSRPFERHDFGWLERWKEQREEASGGGKAHGDCAVEGISCLGCVWLIEKLMMRDAGVVRAVVQPGGGRVHLEWEPGVADLAEAAKELAAFGYVLAPVERAGSVGERRDLTARMGLCGAFALNAMGFSLPVYLGMPEDFAYAGLFRLIAFLSATLAMLVGGSYFITKAWRTLRLGEIHLDLPIALGVSAAYAGSLAGWVLGHEGLIYFDFVATFVFLMLVGRLVQTAAVERNRRRVLRSSPLATVVETESGEKRLEELKAGDRFRWESGRALPVSGLVVEGEAEISLEWISGEAEPVALHEGSRAPAGAILLSQGAVGMRAEEAWEGSMLSRLTAVNEIERRSPLVPRLLRIYMTLVLLLGVGGGAWWAWQGKAVEGLQVMISVFVVSCPCALGVAIPLADEMASTRLARSGGFVRSGGLWARLRRVRKVIFDKTGTLTLERPVLADEGAVERLGDREAAALAMLTQGSIHPVSRALLEALGGRGQAWLRDCGEVEVTEKAGRGVAMVREGTRWSLEKGEPGVTELKEEGRVAAAFRFRDALRPGARGVIEGFRRRGLEVWILSGDAKEKVTHLAELLGIEEGRALGGLLPEEKAEWVRRIDRRDTLFLGDGANDSLAFDAAFVTGTPVVDRSLLETKADFYTLGSGMGAWLEALKVADARAAGIGAAFSFALLYNLGVVAASLGGWMSPLGAAVLMPLSSLISLGLVTAGAGRRRIAKRMEEGYVVSDRQDHGRKGDPTPGGETVRNHSAREASAI